MCENTQIGDDSPSISYVFGKPKLRSQNNRVNPTFFLNIEYVYSPDGSVGGWLRVCMGVK